MKIITISREFGSGGRELGKRLADALGVPCYDQQIIDMIAQEKNLDKNYIAHVSEKDVRMLYPSTIGKHIIAPNYIGHLVHLRYCRGCGAYPCCNPTENL